MIENQCLQEQHCNEKCGYMYCCLIHLRCLINRYNSLSYAYGGWGLSLYCDLILIRFIFHIPIVIFRKIVELSLQNVFDDSDVG